MKRFLEKLLNNHHLSHDEIKDAMEICFTDETSDSEIAALLTALRAKGETPEEIAGLVEIIRHHSNLSSNRLTNVMDNCGTGGDGSHSFNISTTSAFVIAGAGVTIAKHGNRSVSSKTGSADVLEYLGVSLNLKKEQMEEILMENNIAFLYAPHVHHRLKKIMKVRKELGVPTIFNIIGPLTNPVELETQLLGIYRRDMLPMITETLRQLGRKRALVINGAGFMDEASLAGENHAFLLDHGEITSFTIHPADYGFPVYNNDAIKGGGTKENADILLDVLNGKQGPHYDTVMFNAGLGLFANGSATTIDQGIKMAKESLETGAAMEKLQNLIRYSKRYVSV